MKEKIERLHSVYEEFEVAAAPYKKESVCSKGCSFCCREAGRIHITTLEGWVISQAIERLSRSRKVSLKKKLAADMKRRESGKPAPCPFLMKNRACMIYASRPFICRRMYSLKVCSKEQHPVVNRKVMNLADETILRLQRLDDTGYSGHLSYILFMLSTPAFLQTYLDGYFRPEEVQDFGNSHGMIINRMIAFDQTASNA